MSKDTFLKNDEKRIATVIDKNIRKISIFKIIFLTFPVKSFTYYLKETLFISSIFCRAFPIPLATAVNGSSQ